MLSIRLFNLIEMDIFYSHGIRSEPTSTETSTTTTTESTDSTTINTDTTGNTESTETASSQLGLIVGGVIGFTIVLAVAIVVLREREK